MIPIAGSGRDSIVKKHIDISIAEVSEAYAGAVGILWEMVMGEEIHIGGAMATRELAVLAGITKDDRVLDICSALGDRPAISLQSSGAGLPESMQHRQWWRWLHGGRLLPVSMAG